MQTVTIKNGVATLYQTKQTFKTKQKKNVARDKEGFCTNRRINPLGEPNNYKPHIPTNKPPNM